MESCFTYPVYFLWEASPTWGLTVKLPESYLNHKCLAFLTCSQVLVSWGILEPIKTEWQWLSPPVPLQGSAPLLTSLHCCTVLASMVPLQNYQLVQESTQTRKTRVNISSLSFALFLPNCLALAQVGAYQKQSTSVMTPNHFDTHLACSSKNSSEYSECFEGSERGKLEEMSDT